MDTYMWRLWLICLYMWVVDRMLGCCAEGPSILNRRHECLWWIQVVHSVGRISFLSNVSTWTKLRRNLALGWLPLFRHSGAHVGRQCTYTGPPYSAVDCVVDPGISYFFKYDDINSSVCFTVNYGVLILQALLKNWPKSYQNSDGEYQTYSPTILWNSDKYK